MNQSDLRSVNTEHRDASSVSRRAFLAMGGGGALLLFGAARGGLAGASAAARPGSRSVAGAATDTLVFAIPSYPGGWDQDFIGFDPIALSLYKNVMPYLVDYGVAEVDGGSILDTANITPSFAESFEADETGKVWTLKLREGVTFPSGNEMTAEDVKWSKDRAFAAQANVAGIYRLIGLTEPDQVTVVDTYTVKFEQAFASALSSQIQAICLYVYDSVLAKENATDDDPWAKEWMSQNPQDGGYYNVTEAVQDQQIVLTANEAYPGDEPPLATTIRMPVVASAANLRLQLQNGDVDLAMGLSRRDIADLRETEGIEIISSPSNEMVTIDLSVTTAPFDDVRVRQALAYAMPYEAIIANVYGGDARPVSSQVPLEMPGYVDTGYPYTTDLDKAKALLEEAGVDEIETELAFAANDDEQQQLAVLIASQLEEIGVKAELAPLDPATFAERRQSRDIPMQIVYGQYWVNDVEYMLSVSFAEGAYLNHANYSNTEIDAIFEQSHSVADEAERNELWAQVQEIWATDVPRLVLCQPNFNLAVREGVSGWVQPVDSLFRLRYLTKSGGAEA